MNEIGFPVSVDRPSENNLFVRIDLAPVIGTGFSEEISLKSSSDFSFLIKRYALADLFASKIAAVLLRERWQGVKKEARFKGRDYFDIFWLSSREVKPNMPYLKSYLDIDSSETIALMLRDKFKEAENRKGEMKQDLIPFFLETGFVENFVANFEFFSRTFILDS